MVATKWLLQNEVPSKLDGDDGLRLLELTEAIWAKARDAHDEANFLADVIAVIAGEFGAQSAAVVDQTPDRKVHGQTSRWNSTDFPWPWAAEALDREAAGLRSGMTAGVLAVSPTKAVVAPNSVLCLAGRGLNDDCLPQVLLAARALGMAWESVHRSARSAQRVRQLQTILTIAADLGHEREVETLLERIAKASTDLVGCDRASIFLWDREHHELVARPALGVEGGSLRISDHTGIVGEVLRTGQPIRVDDAYADARFSQVVDKASGYRTRNLLCVPLVSVDKQLLGVFEVINKLDGSFTNDDEDLCRTLATQICTALDNTREREALLRSNQQLTEQVTKGVSIIGESSAIAALRSTVRRLAATDLPVLILGESGTGKEVVAQALHYYGPRSERPFVAVNCAALAETLLESELFGHEKGAFTDAREMHRGKFELAEGGTIFLDEIGDMSLGGQAKLLRVLEQKVITRVGGSQAIPINVRVIAATNAKLTEVVRAKKFREDLYFRLNVVTLELPPLRDRSDDVQPLAEHFLKIFSLQARRPKLHLSPDAKRRLQAHAWPGNVRELRNLMERVAFLAPADKVEPEDLAFILSPEKPALVEPSEDQGLSEATNLFQQEFIRRAIRRVQGNMSEAARLMGLHRSNLYRKMRQLGMNEASSMREELEV